MKPPKNEKKTGAQVLVDVLNEKKVPYVFGHTGGAVIPIHVEFNRRMKAKEKTPYFMMFRQEAGAGHAAEGYAAVSGKVAVALGTSGPGATNLVTPIADAYADSLPVVFLTGQTASANIGNDSFQEVDTIGVTRPITKWNYLVKSADDLGPALRSAFHIAATGRPGPVLVDICVDALLNSTTNADGTFVHKGYRPNVRMNKKQADALLEALLAAERPVIIAGAGVEGSGGAREFIEFIEKYNIPVVLTLRALGTVPHEHPRYIGMPGMHGSAPANFTLRDADFIFSVGARLDDRIAVKNFEQGKKIAHIDIDPVEIGKKFKTFYPLAACALDFFKHANKREIAKRRDISDWLTRIDGWKQAHPLTTEPSETRLQPQYLVAEISRLTKDDATIASGVGQHQMWAAQYYRFRRPRQWVSSCGLGSMGYGLPAAIGAYLANPKKPVVLIDGDGSFQMNLQELGTVVQHRMPIKIFILNNSYLGMVRQWEERFFEGYHYECCLGRSADCPPECTEGCDTPTLNPDFAGLAHIYPGLVSKRVTAAVEVAGALQAALKHKGPYLIDFIIRRDEDVLPMIPAGKGLGDMILR